LYGFAGCLKLDTPDGALKCSTVKGRACPEGWYCLQPDNTCWRNGHYPADMAQPNPFFPGGPGDDMSVPADDDMATGADLMSVDDLAETD
jgi:hypothetical protein